MERTANAFHTFKPKGAIIFSAVIVVVFPAFGNFTQFYGVLTPGRFSP